ADEQVRDQPHIRHEKDQAQPRGGDRRIKPPAQNHGNHDDANDPVPDIQSDPQLGRIDGYPAEEDVFAKENEHGEAGRYHAASSAGAAPASACAIPATAWSATMARF